MADKTKDDKKTEELKDKDMEDVKGGFGGRNANNRGKVNRLQRK